MANTLVIPQMSVRKNSTGDGDIENRINFIEAPGVNLGVVPDPTNNEINVTIGASSADPFAKALFDGSCDLLFVKNADGTVELLEGC